MFKDYSLVTFHNFHNFHNLKKMNKGPPRCGNCQNCCPRENQPKLDCQEIKKKKRAEKKRKQRQNKKVKEMTIIDIMNSLNCEKDWAIAVKDRIDGKDFFRNSFSKFFPTQPKYVECPFNCSFEQMTWIDLHNDMLWEDAAESTLEKADKDIDKLKNQKNINQTQYVKQIQNGKKPQNTQ